MALLILACVDPAPPSWSAGALDGVLRNGAFHNLPFFMATARAAGRSRRHLPGQLSIRNPCGPGGVRRGDEHSQSTRHFDLLFFAPFFFPQRASAAFLAIRLRSAALRTLARAGPPTFPPA